MSEIQPRSIVCPCGASWDGFLVLPSRSHGPRTSDLRRYDGGPDPLPKRLNACPACGWVGDVSEFEEHAADRVAVVAARDGFACYSLEQRAEIDDPLLADPRADTTVAALLDTHLRPHAARAVAEPAFRYEQAAQIARWLGHGPLREGDAFLRAAWLHEDGGRPDDGRRCRAMARHAYERGISEKKWFRRREDLAVVAYLCGELRRREGDRESAGRWFEQAVAWSSGLPHLQALVALAERQGRDPKELA
jgi:hypothetical protein